MIDRLIWNRAPLIPSAFAPLPLGAIRPAGWLDAQLKVMRDGITGHLDEVFPDVGPECGWLGGPGDGWERAPYYLHGLVPLAWTLRDSDLMAKAQKYIDWMLSSQREDGQFGPENDDWWPRMVALQCLMLYYTATADVRVPQFMLKYFQFQAKSLDERPLSGWAPARGAENTLCALWLYNLTGKPFLLKLAHKLIGQTTDWSGFFTTFPQTRPMSDTYKWDDLRAAIQREGEGRESAPWAQHHQRTHVVNVSMAIKAPAVEHSVTGGQKAKLSAEAAWEKLMRYHGVAIGMWTGDEHLNGPSPSQGTECCAVVEAMASLEYLVSFTGNAVWGDRLEKLAFNALPATLTPDGWGHQYLQQVNQVRAVAGEHPWYNNGPDSNTFGLEPNFGCCTANLHQGWPLFAQSLWMGAEDGLCAVSYAPCRVRARVSDRAVTVEVAGQYPFEDAVRVSVDPEETTEFSIYLRIPEWVVAGAACSVNGEPLELGALTQESGFARIRRAWSKGDVIELKLPMEPKLTRWYHQTVSVECGPLLYAYDPGEDWSAIRERTHESGLATDWQVLPKGAWNYALIAGAPVTGTPRAAGAVGAFGVGQAPVTLRARAARVPEWQLRGDSAAPPPVCPRVEEGQTEEIELVPYGWTSLRVAQFPCGEM